MLGHYFASGSEGATGFELTLVGKQHGQLGRAQEIADARGDEQQQGVRGTVGSAARGELDKWGGGELRVRKQ